MLNQIGDNFKAREDLDHMSVKKCGKKDHIVSCLASLAAKGN